MTRSCLTSLRYITYIYDMIIESGQQWDTATYATDSYVTRLIHVWYDSSMCYMNGWVIWHDLLIQMMWECASSGIQPHMLLIYMWCNSSMCDLRVNNVRDIIRLYTWCRSVPAAGYSHTCCWFICGVTHPCVTWVNNVCDIIRSCRWCRSVRAAGYSGRYGYWFRCDVTHPCVTWVDNICDMTREYTWYDSLVYMTWWCRSVRAGGYSNICTAICTATYIQQHAQQHIYSNMHSNIYILLPAHSYIMYATHSYLTWLIHLCNEWSIRATWLTHIYDIMM